MRNTSTLQLSRLKKSRDFLYVMSHGTKIVSKSFILIFCKRIGDGARFGVIASKKVGNAVIRNRAKRVVRALCANHSLFKVEMAGYDIVFICRAALLTRAYSLLCRELTYCIKGIVKQ